MGDGARGAPDLRPDTALACNVREAANHEPRRDDAPIDILLLHYTGMVSGQEAVSYLCSAESGVSCHYFIGEEGEIVQMVPEEMRAWHAGVSSWRGHTDINSRSIGIEIANPGHEYGYQPFPEAQMASVVALCRDILVRNAIPARNVVAHSDVAPTRKCDPGEMFDWKRLYEAGIGHWVAPEPIGGTAALGPGDRDEAVALLQRKFADYGYGIEETGRYDELTIATVTAFQRHFRPEKIDGCADRSVFDTLERLMAALPAESSSQS